MKGFSIELKGTDHDIERLIVKVKRTYNMPSDEIKPEFRSRPAYGLSGLLVGRDVDETQVQSYILNYLREKGLYEKLVKFKVV